jgi:hypothetical protein
MLILFQHDLGSPQQNEYMIGERTKLFAMSTEQKDKMFDFKISFHRVFHFFYREQRI